MPLNPWETRATSKIPTVGVTTQMRTNRHQPAGLPLTRAMTPFGTTKSISPNIMIAASISMRKQPSASRGV
jgi:hypothetical protein